MAENMTYIKRKQTTGAGGQFYEIKLIMWYFLLALEAVKNEIIDSFQIGSNVEFAGDFDDIVFKYVKDKKTYVDLIQAKNRDNPEKKFTLEKFFSITKSKKKDYDINSYMKSCDRIGRHFTGPTNYVDRFRVIFFTNSNYNGKYDTKFNTESLSNDMFPDEKINDDCLKFRIIFTKHVENLLKDAGDNAKDFIEKFEVWCNQPGERQFDKIIKQKIELLYLTSEDETNSIYNDVYKRVENWWKLGKDECPNNLDQQSGSIQSENNAQEHLEVNYLDQRNNWFTDSHSRLSELKFERGNFLKIMESNKLELRFNLQEIYKLRDVINNNRMIKISLNKKIKSIAKIKIHQTLEKMACKYILLTFSQLIKLKNVTIDTFRVISNLLVVDFIDQHHQAGDIYQSLKEIMEHYPKKKIITIVEEQQQGFTFENGHELNISICKIDFEELDENSQKKVLDQKINFQGKQISLYKLIPKDFPVCEELLEMLAIGENICVGTINSHAQATVSCTQATISDAKMPLKAQHPVSQIRTFDRTLTRQIELNNVFLETDEDIFAISGITKAELESKVSCEDIIFDFNRDKLNREIAKYRFFVIRNEDDYEKVCLEYKKQRSVHWLACVKCQYESSNTENFFWIMTQGSLINLKKHLKIDSNESYKPEYISHGRNKIVIVAAEPGMGKTTFLSSLTHYDHQKLNWRGRISLLNDYKILKNLKIEDTSVFKYVCHSLGLNAEWERQLFEQYYRNEGRVELMFDGFDEIAPHYVSTVIEMIKWLQNNTKVDKLWITTRLSVLNNLENELNTLAYRLKPFTFKESLKFLFELWTKNTKFINHRKAKAMIKDFLCEFSEKIRDKAFGFISNPLQLKILAEVFKKTFDEQCNNGNYTIEFILGQEEFSIYRLYKEFISKKYFEIVAGKKNMDINNMMHEEMLIKEFKELEVLHFNYALFALFDEEKIKIIIDNKEFVYIQSSLNNVQIGKEKNGIIDDIIDGKPNFIHRTFAEFFTAAGLVRMLMKSQNEKTVGDFLQQIEIFSMHQFVIRSFFDHHTIRNNDDENIIKCSENKFFNAVIANDINTISEMLNKNEIDINCKDKAGRTALHLASSYNHHEIVELLIKHNADVAIEDTLFNWIALRYADMTESWEVVELLLKNGLNPEHLATAFDTKNIFGFCEKGFINLVRILIEFNSSCINISDGFGTPLHYASKNGHTNVVSLLILSGAKATSVNNQGNTALHVAAEHNRLDVVKLFILLEPEVLGAKNNVGRTPLCLALLSEHTEMALVLIQTNLSGVNESDRFERTPMHYASIKGWENIILQLLTSGANAFSKDRYGYTPLHLAVSKKQLGVVKLFINKEPKCLNEKDNKGRTPVLLAIHKNHQGITFTLIQANPSGVNESDRFERTPLHYSSIKGWADVSSRLLNSGANAFAKDKYGYTPLHLAAMQKNEDAVKILIRNKPNYLNEKDNTGKTPLHYASMKGLTKTILLLLDHNANACAKDNDGYTPLHEAVEANNLNVVMLFINLKPNCVNEKDSNGKTPCDLAVALGHIKIVKKLKSITKANQ